MATKGVKPLTTIVVHQALYGYKRGHELLASSTELKPESRASLLILTDMSGPSLIPGFETYLTGVPLDADGMYAFMRTWYAPEMSRPGCVWSHVLLVKQSDLSENPNPEGLTFLFRRPQSGETQSYETAISFDGSSSLCDSGTLDRRRTENLLDAFYSTNLPLMIASSKPQGAESLLLALWSQQGPRGRFSFSFCTGSMSNRKLRGNSLTVQIIPPEVRRQIERESTEVLLLELDGARAHHPWAETLVEEMKHRSGGRMTRLLRSLDFTDSNRVLVSVVATVLLSNEDRDTVETIHAMVNEIGATWPKATQETTAKARLLNSATDLGKLLQIDVSEGLLLRALSTCATPSAFDSAALHLRDRGGCLWSNDKSSAKTLALDLLNGDGNELGDEVLSGLMEAVPDSELWDLVERNSGLVLSLLRRNPSLARSAKIWGLPRIRATDVLDAVKDPSAEIVDGIMLGSLEAHRYDVARHVLERYGSPAASTAVHWIVKHHGLSDAVPVDFLRFIGKHQELVMNLLHQNTLRPEAIAMLLIGLRAEQLESLPIEFFTNYLEKRPKGLPAIIERGVAAMILARGFASPNGGEALVAETFTTIHQALAKSELEYEAWKLLEHHLPGLSWRDWDKCERLRRSLIDKISSYHWPLHILFDATKEASLFKLILKTCRSSASGRALLKKTLKDTAAMRTLTPYQENLLRDTDDLVDYD